MENIIGNKNIKEQLILSIRASKASNQPIPHTLLSGPAGCGKTTTARAIAQNSGAPFFQVSADTKKPEQFAELFNKFPTEGYSDRGSILTGIAFPIVFIDEIHQLNLRAQEILGIAMEEWLIEAKVESDYSDYKRKGLFWIPKFTLIGATTLPGHLSKPFRDRFKVSLLFKPYNEIECAEIAKLHASRAGFVIDDEAALEIAKRSRGTPRVVVTLLQRLGEMAVIQKTRHLTKDLSMSVFQLIGIDSFGLTSLDVSILKALYDVGVPVGLEYLSVISGEDEKTISSSVEPYLIRIGFLARTKRGRVITDSGKKYLEASGIVERQTLRRML